MLYTLQYLCKPRRRLVQLSLLYIVRLPTLSIALTARSTVRSITYIV